MLSFSIETDLWHKACITNITFESLLFFMNLFNVWIQRVSFCYMVHVIWTKFVKWVGCLLMIIRYQKYFCFRFLLIPQTPEELHYTFKTEMSISFSLDSYKMCFHFQNLVLWYYQCFKNVLSFSIETDLWHKACITNITFESLLSFMNWFNVWIQKFAFGNESTFWNCQN